MSKRLLSVVLCLAWIGMTILPCADAQYGGGVMGGGPSGGITSGPGWDFQGTLGGSAIGAYSCLVTLNFPATLVGSQVTCGTSPGQTDTWTVKVGTQGSMVSKGTFTVSSATPCVANFTNVTAAFTCTAGQRLEIDGPATFSGSAPVDEAISLLFSR